MGFLSRESGQTNQSYNIAHDAKTTPCVPRERRHAGNYGGRNRSWCRANRIEFAPRRRQQPPDRLEGRRQYPRKGFPCGSERGIAKGKRRRPPPPLRSFPRKCRGRKQPKGRADPIRPPEEPERNRPANPPAAPLQPQWGHHGARGRRIGHHDGPAVGDAHGGGFAAFQKERVSSSVIAPSQDPSPVDLLGATNRSCPSAVGGELRKTTIVAPIETMAGTHRLAQGDKHASDLEEDLRRRSRRHGNQHQVRAAKRVRSSCRTFPGANRPSPASAASSIPATLSWRASRTTSARRSSSKSSPSSPSASVMPSV